MNANTSAIEDLSPKSTILTRVNKWNIILIKSWQQKESEYILMSKFTRKNSVAT
jgi:hypothetical protein